jgi:putative membrane-bound dehydrogenase-like protein
MRSPLLRTTLFLAIFALPTARLHAQGLPKVPEGFEVRLVAAVPAVEFPCQVATAPGGRLFVAEDPMDQRGPYEADHGRILLFRDGQDPVVFAEGLRAVFGMTWRDGALYVMHMPYLSVFRDDDGDGKADGRKDLFRDLGPGPRALNDHLVSGLQFGIDGKLCISVGDKGVPGATRVEDEQKVQLRGGGTLRCNPDGTGLEVFSSGTRNHLEPNLDERDDLFTYDNTDDGDGWWTRVTHHIDGGYYGYPYDYRPRPDRHLPRMAEYGGGSPCGAVFYREDAWPERYRGLGLWAEWGKRKVHAFRFAPDGASYKVGEEFDFATPGDSGEFRPIDLALSYDGTTLYIADWGMGGWGNKNEKVGRIFAVKWKGEPAATRPRGGDSDDVATQIKQLDHPSWNERTRAQLALAKRGREALIPVSRALLDSSVPALARRHLIWTLDAIAGGTPEATLPTLDVLKDAKEGDLRAQVARALGERAVPIAVGALVAALDDPDVTVRLQAITALGRIGNPEAAPKLVPILASDDRFLAFAARVALRRINAWKDVVKALDSPDPKVRLGLLATLETVYDVDAATALGRFALDPRRDPEERAKAMLYLAETHAQARPWDGRWWGTRPTQGRPPVKDVVWPGTELVRESVRKATADPVVPVRLAALRGLQSIGDPEAGPLLRQRLAAESAPEARREVVRLLGQLKDKESLPLLVAILRDAREASEVRDAALAGVETIGGPEAIDALTDLLDDPKLPAEQAVRAIAAIGRFRAKTAAAKVLAQCGSENALVRSAAAEALGRLGNVEGAPARLQALLEDKDTDVRKAAIAALGRLEVSDTLPTLMRSADDEATQFEATMAIARFADPRAVRVLLRGLGSRNPDLRRACASSLGRMRDEAAPVLERLHERKELSPSLLPELSRIFASARPIMGWRLLGPFAKDAEPPFAVDQAIDQAATFSNKRGREVSWRPVRAIDADGQVDLGRVYDNDGDQSAFGHAEVVSPSTRVASMMVGSDDTLKVWVNGKQAYQSESDRTFAPGQDRFDVELREGPNQVIVRCGNSGGGWQFAVATARPTEYAFLKAPAPDAFNPDAYRDFAVKMRGDVVRGQALFADPKGLACLKCHVVAGQGGTVGPDLTGIGTRYGKAELIESVLYPSAKIFSGYEPVVLAVSDGRVLTGILKADTPEFVEIEDAEAKRIKVAKADVEERKVSDVSIMPNGLAEGLTKQDFADLIAYIESLREQPKK